MPVQRADGIGPPRHFQSQHSHAERLAVVVRLHAAQPHQLIVRDTKRVSHRSKMLFNHAAIKTIMASRHRRVCCKDRLSGHSSHRLVVRIAIAVHASANGLQCGKNRVALIEMVHARHDPHRANGLHSADTQHQFLTDANTRVAAIETAGELAIIRLVAFDIGVEEIEAHATHGHLPDLRKQRARTSVNLHRDRLPVGTQGRFDRQGLNPRLQILLVLVAIDVELLSKISLVIKEPHGHERNPQTAGAFDVVAGEHAQAAGVNWHRFVNPELSRKIDDRLRAEHAGVDVAPRRFARQIFLEAAVGLVDSTVEHKLGCAGLQPLWRKLCQQCDWVVIELPPANRVELPKHIGHFRMPAPPQVSGECRALVVKILRR